MTFALKHLIVLSFSAIEIFAEKCYDGDKKECFNQTSKMEGFIVGGALTTTERFPHAVCLFHYPLYRFFCGSSVLNQQILLTAAHCVEGDGEFSLDAYAGHENVQKVSIIRKVSRFIIHEHYDRESTQHDIALLFLDDSTFPLGGNSPIKRVIIRKQFPVHVNEAEISGWGYINDVTRESSSILKYTKQKVIPLDECQETYFYEWLPGMMCAGDAETDTNRPARGDSGGGLMTAEHQQIGVVSFTMGDYPGLVFYTNVSTYYDWIVNLVEKKVCVDDYE